MINLQYNKKDKILFANYLGEIDKKDILNYYDELFNYKDLSSSLLILQTETKAVFVNSEENIKAPIESIKLLLKEYDYIKIAILQTEPIKTAYSMLFQDITLELENFNAEVFSTKEAAMRWLKN